MLCRCVFLGKSHDKATYLINFDEWRRKAFCLFVLKKQSMTDIMPQ